MSTYGRVFRVTTFGESHGKGVGCIIDGVPPNLKFNLETDIQLQMDRRRPGQSSLTTQRIERDKVYVYSGTEEDAYTGELVTLGTPLTFVIYNEDQRTYDYASTKTIPRPGHADYTYSIKYGITASSGGGRSSARETAARVAAGALGEKWLRDNFGTQIVSWVCSVQDIEIPTTYALFLEQNPPTRQEVDTIGTLQRLKDGKYIDYQKGVHDCDGRLLGYYDELYETDSLDSEIVDPFVCTRCPHVDTAVKIAERIQLLRDQGDSTGGVLTTVITDPPVGIGEPCFDKLEAELAKGVMSLPATKGFEIGEGFRGTKFCGSVYNDRFEKRDEATGILTTMTNHAGGTLGGITHGQPIIFRVAVKPTSSISQDQFTCSYNGTPGVLDIKGRHDPCVLPRAPPLLEGMAALVVTDLTLQQRARSCPHNPISLSLKSVQKEQS